MYKSERDGKARQVVCNCYYCLRSMERNTQNKQHENDVLIIGIFKVGNFFFLCSFQISCFLCHGVGERNPVAAINLHFNLLYFPYMNFIDNLKYKWNSVCIELCLCEVYIIDTISAQSYYISRQCDMRSKTKLYFEWISHKCKMLFNIFFSIHLTSLFFFCHIILNLFTLALLLSQFCTYGYVWVEDMENISFFLSLSACEYWNVSYHLLNQSPCIQSTGILYIFFISLHPMLFTSMRVYF